MIIAVSSVESNVWLLSSGGKLMIYTASYEFSYEFQYYIYDVL